MANTSSVSANYINQQSLGIELSKRVKENFFQNIITKAGEACDEGYVDNTELSTVLINRQLPFNIPSRRIGASVNGGFFNSLGLIQPVGDQYELSMTIVMDFSVVISANLEGMTPIPIMENAVQNIGGNLNQEINASTIAEQLRVNLIANDQGIIENVIYVDPTIDGYAVDGIEDAVATLNEGNPEMGIDTYPMDRRAMYLRSSYIASLRKSKGFLILNSNYGQEMREEAGVSKGSNADTITGVYGRIDGVPVYLIADVTWANAASYLGLPGSSFNSLQGIVVSATGTARGLAFANNMKVVDSIQGQGLIVQPKYRWGVATLDPKSVVCIAKNDFVSPFSGEAQVLQPVGSRTYASTAVTITVDGTAATVIADPNVTVNQRYQNQLVGAVTITSNQSAGTPVAVVIAGQQAGQTFLITDLKGAFVPANAVPVSVGKNSYYVWFFGGTSNNLIAAVRTSLVITGS